MQIIIDEYKRELQKVKMELSEQIEENVRLKGFKQMVMQKPEDFDNDRSFENDTRINLFDEERIEFKALQNRIKELELIDKSHQELNGKLRQEIEEVKKEHDVLMMNKITKYENELAEVKADNKKLAMQVEDIKMNHMRKSGM